MSKFESINIVPVSQAYYSLNGKMEIIDSNSGGEACYNMPKEFINKAIELNALVLDNHIQHNKVDGKNKTYILSNEYKLNLGSSLLWLIGENDNKHEHKIIVVESSKNGKFILFKTVFKELEKDDNGFCWFNKLYEKNVEGFAVVYSIDEIRKEIIIDLRLNNVKNIEANDDILTPEWFKSKEANYTEDDKRANELYKEFNNKFGKEALINLSGKDLLNRLFLHESNKGNMCYLLEYDSEYRKYFGGIGGGSAYKHILFYNKKEKCWKTGTSKSNTNLSEEDAIKKAEEIKESLIEGYNYINENIDKFSDIKFYDDLYDTLCEKTNELINSVTYCKYYHMMFPNLFPTYYNVEWINRVLKTINIECSGNFISKWGRIQHFINKCDISDVVFNRILHDYYNEHGYDNIDDYSDENEENMKVEFGNYKEGEGINLVIYGTPGCGKSYMLNEMLTKVKYKDNDGKYQDGLKIPEDHIIRTTFHHDYSNTDFVGQVVPDVKRDGSAEYKINPGPFTKALKLALETKGNVALVIEELNRGDAAGIFGDIFQLLDRFKETVAEEKQYKGVSQYAIENNLIQNYLTEETHYKFDCIRIPSNLYIFATMNTSDQNVFTLDTAFKRRWDFVKLKNDPDKFKEKYKNFYVPGSKTLWADFVKKINEKMLELDGNLNEDKQLGVYFVDFSLLSEREDGKDKKDDDGDKKRKFAYKLLEYLWNDVARYDKYKLFKNTNVINTLDKLIEEFCNNEDSLNIFDVDFK